MEFLGLTVAGIEPEQCLTDRLEAAENRLSNEWSSAGNPGTLAGWAGLTDISVHATPTRPPPKCCIDVNYWRNPYIATRTYSASGAVKYGGERGAQGIGDFYRRRAVEACDRAVQWVALTPNLSIQADLSVARQGESSETIYRRFKNASNALVVYLSIAFNPSGPREITRAPIANIDSMSLYDILMLIRTGPGELRADTEIVIDLATALGISVNVPPGTISSLPRAFVDNLPAAIATLWRQILIDYEAVRIPMVIGTPVPAPPRTRNPIYGFLTLSEQLVAALRDSGLYWGACDLGQEYSGDMMHFQTRQGCIA